MSSDDSLPSLTPLVNIQPATSEEKHKRFLYAGFEITQLGTQLGKRLIDVGRLTRGDNLGSRLVSTPKWKQIISHTVTLQNPIDYYATCIVIKRELLVQCAYAMVTGFLPKLVDVAGRPRNPGGPKRMKPNLSGIDTDELKQICALLMEDHSVKVKGKEQVELVLEALRRAGTKPDGSDPGKAGLKEDFAINLVDSKVAGARKELCGKGPVTFDGDTLSIEDFLSRMKDEI